jgi:hypothetical protein
MTNDVARILAEVPNSGVVQMPGRRFPALVIFTDSLSQMFDDLAGALKGAKNSRDEESYYGILMAAERIQDLLSAYEEVLMASGIERPYAVPIGERLVHDSFEA